MLRGLLPKEYAFFDYFDQLISTDKQISILFLSMMNNEGGRVELSKQIKDLERNADKLSRNCTDLLHKTFITPIDRNDIFTLVKRLDDLADQINAAAFRISAYNVTDIRYEAVEFSKIIQSCIEELIVAIRELRKIKNKNQILECCKRVHDLENQADEILRSAVSRLFKEGEVLLLIKWKEIFERLEKAVDKCEDIAGTIESILIEQS
ncbi:MAG: DUF47 family protein [Bacteroidales bacterium]|nr:DUF47 family protein [Bacteroidales bacterium]